MIIFLFHEVCCSTDQHDGLQFSVIFFSFNTIQSLYIVHDKNYNVLYVMGERGSVQEMLMLHIIWGDHVAKHLASFISEDQN